MKKVVRIVQTRDAKDGYYIHEGGRITTKFLNILADMNVITQHKVDPKGLTVLCFDINCPEGILEPGLWAVCTADKMRSLGFNAVVAPSTEI